MKLIISFSKDGKALGEKLAEFISGKHINSKDFDGSIKKYIEENWRELDFIIFISSTGIAIRYIKDAIISKDVDPGILVIDDLGKNVISLLSGHLGGANKLTREIAGKLNSNPVITTATDNRNIEAVDVYSKRNNLEIKRIKDIKSISTLMIEGEKIGFYSDIKIEKIDYKNIVEIENLDNLKDVSGIIIITNKIIEIPEIPSIILRPKNLVIGIGCRRGKPKEEIINAIKEDFGKLNLSEKSIKEIGTIEIKKDEKGIIETAEHYNVNLKIFTVEEISKVEDKFEKSDFVKKTVGVYNVSEPVAYLLGGEILQGKARHDGITISIGEINK